MVSLFCSCSWAEPYRIDVRADERPIRAGHLQLGPTAGADGQTLDVNSLYFLRNGQPWLPVMGEIHYARIPRADWDDAILKMKAAGIDVLATYVFWIHHEEIEGRYDWTSERALRDFVEACRRHGVYVVVRVGPWSHGEARNGGFPDWLLKKSKEEGFKLRSDDPKFLKYVETFYDEIGRQLKGLYFKDGGPIVGVQIENELRFNSRGGYAYMKELKRLAVKAGIVVPFYTCTGWPAIMKGQTEFLPLGGGYPDAPWDQKQLKRIVQDAYRFQPAKNDPLIGADLLGKHDEDVRKPEEFSLYPDANAEMGGGVQVTYHRRPIIAPEDVAAMAFVKLGSGANMLGYYMFAGGRNPDGKLSTLQESRATKYPNDCPIKTYDFQAPIGEWGQIRDSYYEFRLIHSFIDAVGRDLAVMPPFFPKTQPKNSLDAETLRFAVRAKNDRGFVFISNYQRYGEMRDLKDVQIEVVTKRGTQRIPETPTVVAKNAMCVWPFNLPLEDANLIYATAQPLHIVKNGQDSLYVFFANGESSQYVFDAKTIKAATAENDSVEIARKDEKIYATAKLPGTGCLLRVETAQGKSVKILTLTRRQALHCWCGKLWGETRLVLSDDELIPGEPTLRLRSVGSPKFEFSLYPDAPLAFLSNAPLKLAQDGLFTRYRTELPERKIAVSFMPCDENDAKMSDEQAPQPGPLYGEKFQALPGAKNWRLDVPKDALKELSDLYLRFDMTGDTAALYADDRLVDDWFIFGPTMTVSLKNVRPPMEKGDLKLQIVPLTASRKIFFEDAEMAKSGLNASLKNVEALPVYEIAVAPAGQSP